MTTRHGGSRNAVVSLLTTMDGETTFEVANIGNEGIVGVPVFLGVETVGARERYQVEIAGQARAMPVGAFLEAAQRDPLRGLVQHFVQALFIQAPSDWPAPRSIPSKPGTAAGCC